MSVGVLAVLALLILVNALYVAAEFASVSVRRSRIRQRAEQGSGLARRLLPYLDDPHRLDRYIAACQIGITISSLVLGAYGQARLAPTLAPLFSGLGGMQAVAAQSAAAVTILVVLTVLQMVLGELVPKSLALQFPTTIALYTVVPMQWSLRALSWFIAVLNGSGVAILRLLGVRNTGHRHLHSPEEIQYLISESREGGLLEPDEHERLRRALNLGVLRVGELMVPRVRIQGIDADMPYAEACETVTASPYTRVPVFEGTVDRIVGFVHVQDVVRHALDRGAGGLRDLLRPILIVPEGMTAERALARLREEKQHIALVVDEYGGTAGLLTVSDVLDEIFGGVADEFKAEEERPERLEDGRVRLPGSIRLDEAAEWVGVHWTAESHTVAGAVAEALAHVPEIGERLVLEGVRLEVERVQAHVVESVIAEPVTLPEEDDDDVE